MRVEKSRIISRKKGSAGAEAPADPFFRSLLANNFNLISLDHLPHLPQHLPHLGGAPQKTVQFLGLAAASVRALTWPKPRIFSGIAAIPTARWWFLGLSRSI